MDGLLETLNVPSDPEAMAAVRESRSSTETTSGEEMTEIMARRLGRGAASSIGSNSPGPSAQLPCRGSDLRRQDFQRVIYRIVDDEVVVEVISLSHRRDAYR